MRAFGDTCSGFELLQAVEMFELFVCGEPASKIASKFGISLAKFATRRSFVSRQVHKRMQARDRVEWDAYARTPGLRVDYQAYQAQWLRAIRAYREELV